MTREEYYNLIKKLCYEVIKEKPTLKLQGDHDSVADIICVEDQDCFPKIITPDREKLKKEIIKYHTQKREQ